MSDQVTEHWTKALKEAFSKEAAKVVEEEIEATVDRVRARLSETKQALIERMVERLKVVQRHEHSSMRFEIVISTDML